jgi:hypothetical protein
MWSKDAHLTYFAASTAEQNCLETCELSSVYFFSLTARFRFISLCLTCIVRSLVSSERGSRNATKTKKLNGDELESLDCPTSVHRRPSPLFHFIVAVSEVTKEINHRNRLSKYSLCNTIIGILDKNNPKFKQI